MAQERGFWLMLPWVMLIGMPMFRPGLPPTEDGMIHAYRVLEMHRLWQAGIFYPRWAPDLAFGLGAPLFHFHGPLFPWLAAAGMALGLPLEVSLKIPLAGLLLLGSAGVYGLARRWGLSERAALVAALAFASAPFRIRELYWQGNFPQYLALSLLPWALLTLHQAIRERRWVWRFAAAGSIALLLLSHNITAMLSAPLLAGYGLGVIVAERLPVSRVRVGLHVAALGIGLAAFFVIPAIADRPLVHLDRLLRGEYDFRKHFLDLGSLFSMPPLYDDRLGNRRLILTLGLHQVLLALPAVAWLAREGGNDQGSDRRRALAIGCGAVLAGMVWMMLPVSQPIWERVPLLAYAEFPWRWLGPAALSLALLIGLGVDALPPRAQGLWMLFACGMLIVGSLGLLYNGGTHTRLLYPSLSDLHAYERWHRYPGLTSVGELFPRWVWGEIEGSPIEEAYRAREEPIRLDRASLPPGASVRTLKLGPLDQRYAVDLPVEGNLRFYVLAFPGWIVQVDGRPAPMWVEARTGWLRAEIPAGSHEIRLLFGSLPQWRLLELFSMGLAISGFWRLIAIWRPGRITGSRLRAVITRAANFSQHVQAIGGAWRAWSAAERSMLLIGGLALLGQVPYRLWLATRVTLDRPPGATSHLQVDYAGRIRLLGYRMEPADATPGGQVRLTLWWRALRPMDDQYSAYVHVYPVSGEPRLAFQSDHMHPADVPTSAWDVERVYQDLHLLRVPEGTKPGLYRIRVGLYERLNPGSRLRIDGSGEDGFDLPQLLVIARPVSPVMEPIVFGGKIRLAGVEAPAEVPAGTPWEVWLAFEALRPLDVDYTLFVHVVDREGNVESQRDLWQPTSRWPVGVEIPLAISLDGLSRPGRYALRIGWYKWPEILHLLLDLPSASEPAYVHPVPIMVR
ncbi:6-pyruvoyl-tetrahydropterin synthase-related protein [Thermoflexus sp.]|uniref:6-pyruvoyl-tetrahydropterin synthase-related protein n=1 Tax=Thermoflexus sp. TaxID=1969742 RepID=UPI002ADE51A7|nr:6-pyruvoyl-tetrahydropterin synthase-related protein [Thermoflexus sp.]